MELKQVICAFVEGVYTERGALAASEALREGERAIAELSIKFRNEVRNEEQAARKDILRDFAISVRVRPAEEISRGFVRDIPEGVDEVITFLLQATEATMESHREHVKRYGTGPSLNEHVYSVPYYRFHGVLCHSGGGHILIPSPMRCDDALWERLKAGDIRQFLTPNFGGSRPWPTK